MIHVILGIPTSGKSIELIKIYKQYRKSKTMFATERVVYVPEIEYKVVSRLYQEGVDANKIKNIDELRLLEDTCGAIFIDEVENLKGEFADDLYQISKNRDVFVTAIPMDMEGTAYTEVGKLLCYADKITHLKPICSICDSYTATKYMMIGTESKYLKLCPECNK